MRYPILMADVVASRKSVPSKLMDELNKVVGHINSIRQDLVSPLTITLGDEFQGIAPNVREGIGIIFEIEEYIIGQKFDFKLKYVLNFGEIGTEVNRQVAHGMLGEGLTSARENLEKLKGEDRRFLILLDSAQVRTQEILNQLLLIYENYVDSWKQKDLESVHLFLGKHDYKIVAQKVNIDPSSAWRRKKSLNIREYETIKDVILALAPTT